MSMLKLGVSVLSLLLIIFMGIFLVIFYDQAVDDFLITPLSEISHSISANVGLGVGYEETLTTLDNSYSSRQIPFDLLFVLLFLMVFVGTTQAAMQTKKQGVFTFFGYIFLGSMLFLMSVFFIAQFTDYFVQNIFIPIFNDTILDTPIIFFFFENLKWIAFVMFLWLGLVNQFDLKDVVRSAGERIGLGDSGGLQR